ncbi:lysostaphin resistance A-like protein [Anatilimnocola sp. NA78]|uniref:CPBP family intramembrane glutamic endopeptidase n=1 Tax=Anatilimnocola sp. NA78 TaxID=3415683 RepID=UPI003CE4DE62
MSLVMLYGSLVLTFFAGSIVMWTWLALRLSRGQTIVEFQPRRLVPWGLADLFLAFAILVLSSFFASAIFTIARPAQPPVVASSPVERGDAKQTEEQTTAKPRRIDALKKLTLPEARQLVSLDSAIKAITAVLTFALITFRLRPTLDDWGLSLRHWRADWQIGTGAFLAAFLPMMLLQFVLVNVVGWKYEHELIELAKSKDIPFFALAILSAVVMAPLFEEFVFRGLLQGWLDKIFSRQATDKSILLGSRAESSPVIAASSTEGEVVFIADEHANPYAAPVAYEAAVLAGNTTAEATNRTSWLSIAISASVFSLLHYSQGPAWIPLLIFGAALGYVYQRTHRLWPGIIAHFLLNGQTMVGLLIQTFFGPVEV